MKRAQQAAPNLKFEKDGIIQTSPVVAKNTLKDPPTWLKVATTLEKPPTPTHYNWCWSIMIIAKNPQKMCFNMCK